MATNILGGNRGNNRDNDLFEGQIEVNLADKETLDNLSKNLDSVTIQLEKNNKNLESIGSLKSLKIEGIDDFTERLKSAIAQSNQIEIKQSLEESIPPSSSTSPLPSQSTETTPSVVPTSESTVPPIVTPPSQNGSIDETFFNRLSDWVLQEKDNQLVYNQEIQQYVLDAVSSIRDVAQTMGASGQEYNLQGLIHDFVIGLREGMQQQYIEETGEPISAEGTASIENFANEVQHGIEQQLGLGRGNNALLESIKNLIGFQNAVIQDANNDTLGDQETQRETAKEQHTIFTTIADSLKDIDKKLESMGKKSNSSKGSSDGLGSLVGKFGALAGLGVGIAGVGIGIIALVGALAATALIGDKVIEGGEILGTAIGHFMNTVTGGFADNPENFKKFAESIKPFQELDGMKLIAAGGGIAALGAGFAAFGLGSGVKAIGDVFSAAGDWVSNYIKGGDGKDTTNPLLKLLSDFSTVKVDLPIITNNVAALIAYSTGITAFGAGSGIKSIGDFLDGTFGAIGRVQTAPILDQLRAFTEGEQIDLPKMTNNAKALGIYGLAIAALGAGSGIKAIGDFLDGTFGAIGRVQTGPVLQRLRDFTEGESILLDKVKNNSDALISYAKGIATLGAMDVSTNMLKAMTGWITGLAGLFSREKKEHPLEAVKTFAEYDISKESVLKNADSLILFTKKMQEISALNASGGKTELISSFFGGISGIFENDEKNPLVMLERLSKIDVTPEKVDLMVKSLKTFSDSSFGDIELPDGFQSFAKSMKKISTDQIEKIHSIVSLMGVVEPSTVGIEKKDALVQDIRMFGEILKELGQIQFDPAKGIFALTEDKLTTALERTSKIMGFAQMLKDAKNQQQTGFVSSVSQKDQFSNEDIAFSINQSSLALQEKREALMMNTAEGIVNKTQADAATAAMLSSNNIMSTNNATNIVTVNAPQTSFNQARTSLFNNNVKSTVSMNG